jgi:hypothetical protein
VKANNEKKYDLLELVIVFMFGLLAGGILGTIIPMW